MFDGEYVMLKLNTPLLIQDIYGEPRAGGSSEAKYFIVATDEFLQSLAKSPYYSCHAARLAQETANREGKPCAILECKVVWRTK